MAKKQIKEVEEKIQAPAVETQAEETVDNDLEVTVQYINPIVGLTGRVFSKEIHGKDFKKTAAQFAESNRGIIK